MTRRHAGERTAAPRTIAVAHPSADVYGADLQLLETVTALVEAGAHVVVAVQGDGPLVAELRARGADVTSMSFPVLRKSAMTPRGFATLLAQTVTALPRLVRYLRRADADALLVNTITIPWWLLAGRLVRLRTIGHVHEAEQDGSRLIRTMLAAPNLLATGLVVNSRSSAAALVQVLPGLASRITVVHNGVAGPPEPPDPPRARTPADPLRLVVVGRLSPRKGTDVAVEAVALLAAAGIGVSLDVYGSVFEGYEWFEQELRSRAAADDLQGRVTFHGYVHPVWTALAAADVVLVPSRVEPFGNTAVEALLARRPLVASDTQGLAEIVVDGTTGLQSVPGDPDSLFTAVHRLATDPDLARHLADAGRQDALSRFGQDRYRDRMRGVMGLPERPARGGDADTGS